MIDDYLSIGQMAKLNHISTQALRIYDRKGLLRPAYQDETSGYRYYHIDQCERLDFIHTMQICGMNLEQIKHHLSEASPDELYLMLTEQEQKLEQEINRLTGSLGTIRRLTSNLNRLKSLPPKGQAVFEYMPLRRIDTFQTEIDFFEKGYSGYEIMLREFKSHMIENELPLSYFFNAGTLIEKNDFIQQNYCAKTVFIFVDSDYPQRPSQRMLPESMYITIYADDIACERSYAHKLFSEMKKSGYQAMGDYLCEVIMHTPHMGREQRQITYRLQIPVYRVKEAADSDSASGGADMD